MADGKLPPLPPGFELESGSSPALPPLPPGFELEPAPAFSGPFPPHDSAAIARNRREVFSLPDPNARTPRTVAEAARETGKVVLGAVPAAGKSIIDATRGGVGLAGQALEGMTSDTGPNATGNPLSRFGTALREEAATGSLAQLSDQPEFNRLITPESGAGQLSQTLLSTPVAFAPLAYGSLPTAARTGTSFLTRAIPMTPEFGSLGLSSGGQVAAFSGLHGANEANKELAGDDPNRAAKMLGATTINAGAGYVAGKLMPETQPLSRAIVGAPWKDSASLSTQTAISKWLGESAVKSGIAAGTLTGGQVASKSITGGEIPDLGPTFLSNLAAQVGFTVAHGAAQARGGMKAWQNNPDGSFSFKAEGVDPNGKPIQTWVTAKVDPDGLVKVAVPTAPGEGAWVTVDKIPEPSAPAMPKVTPALESNLAPNEVEHQGSVYGLDPSGQVYERLPDGTTQAATVPPVEAIAKLRDRVEAVKSAGLTQAEAAIHPYNWQIQKQAQAERAALQTPPEPPAPSEPVTVAPAKEAPAYPVSYKQFKTTLPEELQDDFETRHEALWDRPRAVKEQIDLLQEQMDALRAKVQHEVVAHWGDSNAKARTTEALNNLPAWGDMQAQMSDLLSAHHQSFQEYPAQAQALRDEFSKRAVAKPTGMPKVVEGVEHGPDNAQDRGASGSEAPAQGNGLGLSGPASADLREGDGGGETGQLGPPAPALPARLAPLPTGGRLLHGSPLEGLSDLSPAKGSQDKGNAQFGTATYGTDAPVLSEKFMYGRGVLKGQTGGIYSYSTNIQAPFDFRESTHYTPDEAAALGLEGVTVPVDGLALRLLIMYKTGDPLAFARFMQSKGYDGFMADYNGHRIWGSYNEGHSSDLKFHGNVAEAADHLAEIKRQAMGMASPKEDARAVQQQGSEGVGAYTGGREGAGGTGEGGGVGRGLERVGPPRTLETPAPGPGEAAQAPEAAATASAAEVPKETQVALDFLGRSDLEEMAKDAGDSIREMIHSIVGTPPGVREVMDHLDAGGDPAVALDEHPELEPFHVGEGQFKVEDSTPYWNDGDGWIPLSAENFASLYQGERAKETTTLRHLYAGLNLKEAVQAILPRSYQAYGENIGKFEGLTKLPSRFAQERPETFGWVYEQIKRWDDQVKQHEASHIEPRRAFLGVSPEDAHQLGAFLADARFEPNEEATAVLQAFHQSVQAHWEARIREAEARIASLTESARQAEIDYRAVEKAGDHAGATRLHQWIARAERVAAKTKARIPEYQSYRDEAMEKAANAKARGHRYTPEELKAKGIAPKAADATPAYLQDYTDQIQELEDASRSRAMLSKMRAQFRLAELDGALASATDLSEVHKIEQEIADTEDSIDAAQWLANKYKEIRLTDTAYFPLHRKGDWAVKWMAEDKDGNPFPLGFILGKKGEVLGRAAEMERLNPGLKPVGVKRSPVLNWKKDLIRTKAIPVSKIEKAALMSGLSSGMAEKLAYELETLDLENAYAGNFKAHLRGVKGVPGFETDPIAAHAEYTAGAAKYRAHLLHTHEISRRIADLEGDRIGEDGVDWGVSKHKDDINYLKKLTADVFSNPVSPWIARIQTLTAMSALGLNPAFILQQGVQKLTHEETTLAAIYSLPVRSKAILTATALASEMAMRSVPDRLQGKSPKPWEVITPDYLKLVSSDPAVRESLAKEMQKALRHAEEEGLFLDQVRQETRRQAAGEDSALSRTQERAERSVFSMVSATENHNRRQTFIAQFLLARTAGFPVRPGLDVNMEPDKIGGFGPDYQMKVLSPKAAEILAAKQVDWIHNRRGVTNRSELQRAARGIFMPMTQFKYFTIEYLQQMKHVLKSSYAQERARGKSKTQAAMAASMPVARSMGWHLAAAGIMGVPFLTAMVDLVYLLMNEVFGPLFKGQDFRPWKHWRQAIRENMEKAGAKPWMVNLFFRGSGSFLGLSMERSLGLGDAFQINRQDSLTETAVDLGLGVAGQNIQQISRGFKKARAGEYTQAVAALPGVPKGIRQTVSAVEEDKQHLGGGRNLDLTPTERSARAVGLMPMRMAEASDIAANQNWEAQNARERKDWFSKRIGKAFEDASTPATAKQGAADLSNLFQGMAFYNRDMAKEGRFDEMVNPKDMKAPIKDVTGGTRKGVAFQRELQRRTINR